MAAVTTIRDHEFYGTTAHLPRKRVTATVSLGNPYAAGGIAFGAAEIQAALRTALGRTDVSVSHIHALEVLGSSDPSYSYEYDAVAGKILCYIQPAASLNAGALPSVAWSDELVVNAHVATLPAGTKPLAVEGIAGLAKPAFIQYTAAGATQEVTYDPAAGTLTFLAADSCTACRVLLLTLGTLPTINSTAAPAEAGAVDLTNYTFSVAAYVS